MASHSRIQPNGNCISTTKYNNAHTLTHSDRTCTIYILWIYFSSFFSTRKETKSHTHLFICIYWLILCYIFSVKFSLFGYFAMLLFAPFLATSTWFAGVQTNKFIDEMHQKNLKKKLKLKRLSLYQSSCFNRNNFASFSLIGMKCVFSSFLSFFSYAIYFFFSSHWFNTLCKSFCGEQKYVYARNFRSFGSSSSLHFFSLLVNLLCGNVTFAFPFCSSHCLAVNFLFFFSKY